MATTWAELIVESKTDDLVGGTIYGTASSKFIATSPPSSSSSSSSSSQLLDSEILPTSKLSFCQTYDKASHPSSLPPSASTSSSAQRVSAMASESAATLSFLGDLASLGSSSVWPAPEKIIRGRVLSPFF